MTSELVNLVYQQALEFFFQGVHSLLKTMWHRHGHEYRQEVHHFLKN